MSSILFSRHISSFCNYVNGTNLLINDIYQEKKEQVIWEIFLASEKEQRSRRTLEEHNGYTASIWEEALSADPHHSTTGMMILWSGMLLGN